MSSMLAECKKVADDASGVQDADGMRIGSLHLEVHLVDCLCHSSMLP